MNIFKICICLLLATFVCATPTIKLMDELCEFIYISQVNEITSVLHGSVN